jgi:alcohol dehydrogenase (cytochrome c)
VRDYDFQLPPILGRAGNLDAVFGAGKAGRVIAWDQGSHSRLWETEVGVHRNDHGSLPRKPVDVCPGLLGGVETPMASANGRLFVPVVDLCMKGSSIGYEPLAKVNVSARGRGELVALDEATGKVAWTVHLPQPDFGCATAADGVVFTSTYDGTVLGLSTADGSVLWHSKLRAGVNACPSLARGVLLVGAGVPRGGGSVRELTAFRLGSP